MENILRTKRKQFRIIQQNAQNLDPFSHQFLCDEQNTAKNMLFQVAENDCPLIDQKTIRLNQWLKTQTKSVHRQYFTPLRHNKIMRKTMHLKPFAEHRTPNQSYQSQQNIQDSIIPHLKLQLRKLESPQKRRQAQQKKRKLEYLQQKMRRKNDVVLVEQLIQNKKPSLRVKKTQSQKKSNLIFFNNFAQAKKANLLLVEKSPTEQIEMIKQARKNRTLKNLLF